YMLVPTLLSNRLHNSLYIFFLLLTRPPPRSALFPYTTLFRSLIWNRCQEITHRNLVQSMQRPLFTFHSMRIPTLETSRLKLRTLDRKSTRLNSSHVSISYAVFCLKKKKEHKDSFNAHEYTTTQ